jgi:hypothetical protein
MVQFGTTQDKGLIDEQIGGIDNPSLKASLLSYEACVLAHPTTGCKQQ